MAAADAPDKSVTGLPGRRPAETAAFLSAMGLLIAKAFGVDDPDTIVAIGVVIGFVPTIVTTIVEWNRNRKRKGTG